MSSWKKASKANQKTHRERHQPESRLHLGLLEKKKDYKQRAVDHNAKQKSLKLLKRRALNKNPDEFYFHMINSEIVEGVHHEQDLNDEHTPEQIKLMQSQDLRYITLRRSMEKKKIEKLKSQLHLLDVANETPNTHTFFVDSEVEAKTFDVLKHLDTHPALLNRKINRMRLRDLEKISLPVINKATAQELKLKKKKMYNELSKRIVREKEFGVIQSKLEIKRHLATAQDNKPQRIKPATKDAPPIYKWNYERKK